jgi:ribosomal-protein-alanine N-acetyltransferase
MEAAMNASCLVHIRWLIRRDMPEVLQIEHDSFEHPWTEDEFLAALREGNRIAFAAEVGEQVAGYMLYEMHKTRFHIHNFAVRPDHRRQGVGRKMIERLLSKLSYYGRKTVTTEVRETNLAAQLFFRSLGFVATKVLRAYYDNGEDAYRMHYVLPEVAA